MIRLRAFCASLVIASASSSIINLKVPLNMVRVEAKFNICPLTIPIPRSSEAFNSKTMALNWAGVYNCLAHANIVLVLPVPGGP